MGDVNCHRFNQKLKIMDEGSCSIEHAFEILSECSTNASQHYEYGEAAIAATSFGLSRSGQDFIEIGFDAPDKMRIHSDRLHYPPGFLSRLFSTKGHFWIKGTKDYATSVIRDYFNLPRGEFEARYATFLRR